jgi:hypothetical protein
MKSQRYLSFLLIMLFISTSSNAYTDDCTDLKVGVAKKVNHGRNQSRSLVPMKYTIKRSDDSTYQLYFNLRFQNKTPHTYADIDKTWKERVQGCYTKYNQKNILTDGYGRKLKLNIWDKSLHRSIPKPASIKIKIKSYPHRSNSIEYSNFIDCETILHEALHLAGLADEYQETESVLNPNYLERITGKPFKDDHYGGNAFDCRASSIYGSIMSDHFYAFTEDRVLRSGHIDTIVYPNCSKKNKVYYACVKNFQRTSRSNGGFFGCAKMPDICNTEYWAGF